MIENWYKLAKDESYMDDEESPTVDFSGKTPQEILDTIGNENQHGDCFEVSGKLVLDQFILGGSKNLILVHGIVTGQGPIGGVQYGHGWVEDGEEVIDKSQGRNLRLPKQLYYSLGNIDPANTFRYDTEETRKKILEYGHWGPWDLQSDL